MNNQNEIAIRCEKVVVEYKIYDHKFGTLKEFVFNKLRGQGKARTLKAVNNVSIYAKRGESIALVGHNGSCKSTLLKVLAGIITPNAGTVQAAKRIAPMIELGAGFDMELSGRDNIFLSCMLMGMEESVIKDRYNEIVTFVTAQVKWGQWAS